MPNALSLSQVAVTPDIMDQGRFLLLLGTVPGGGDTDELGLRCFTAVLPGVSSEVMEVPMHGFTFRYRGRKTHTSPMSVSFWNDSRFDTYNILYDWTEAVTETESGNSQGYLPDYSVTAQLSKFDTTGVEASRFQIEQAFPQDLTDLTYSDESSTPLQVQVQFAFRNKRRII